METKAPICPEDSKECTGFQSLEGCADCHNCDRFYNGVRETGAMPTAEWICNGIKKLIKGK